MCCFISVQDKITKGNSRIFLGGGGGSIGTREPIIHKEGPNLSLANDVFNL